MDLGLSDYSQHNSPKNDEETSVASLMTLAIRINEDFLAEKTH